MTSGTIFPGYGTHLVPGVFPTPLYEVIMCLLLFGVLWGIRKRIALPGVLFCIYLIMNGVERFLIEHIRVNNLFIGTWTQAEIISLGLVIIGVGGILWLRKRNSNGQPERAH
ncbi:MAG: prolipoprotein diacylglyceryl transferase [Flavobacteriales bacterium]|nr:prolipoprotein diacylglyceryl transferase [Flavobacteriales bacterium]